jgi:hypothetical protein
VANLVKSLLGGFTGPLIFEWDRMWSPDLAPAEEVMPEAARRLFGWVAEAQGEKRSPAEVGV